jgi:5,10-methylenetetrahydromethanopterin reductase
MPVPRVERFAKHSSESRIHSQGFGSPRPINVPLLVAPIGPKGFAIAEEIADGSVLASEPVDSLDRRWTIQALLFTGTISEPADDHTTQRVKDALGPVFVTGYHAVWQRRNEAVDEMPGALNGEPGLRPNGQVGTDTYRSARAIS